LGVLNSVDHPNIVKFYEIYEDEKFMHIVMEHCSGGELIDRIIQKGTFMEAETCRIIYKILHAINHLHEAKIVHRDLKPENFLFESTSP
jgi:calcium-dependent protein kinase